MKTSAKYFDLAVGP